MSEIDLGIRWVGCQFLPSGAKVLDDALVNEPLRWIRQRGHETVAAPFEKALAHLLGAQTKPELLPDVITDAFETLEALAKIVTGKEKTLDANQ